MIAMLVTTGQSYGTSYTRLYAVSNVCSFRVSVMLHANEPCATKENQKNDIAIKLHFSYLLPAYQLDTQFRKEKPLMKKVNM